jgi:hypothetical protein
MNRKIIIILIILLALFLIIIGGSWFVARKNAQKSGSASPTFKEFIGLGTKPATPINGNGDLSSDFTNPNGSGKTTGGADTTSSSSQFTNNTFLPAGGAMTGTDNLNGNGGYNPNGNINTGAGYSGPNTSVGTSGSSGTTASTPAAIPCSDLETTITFTPAEIARLNDLQRRFYAIAPNLQNDSSAAAELSTYSGYILQEKKITEMTAYCESKLAQLPAIYNRHVPTPFWHNLSLDTNTFTIGTPSNSLQTGNVLNAKMQTERILRLNLW